MKTRNARSSGAIHIFFIVFLLIVLGVGFLVVQTVDYYRQEIAILERKVLALEKRMTDLDFRVTTLETKPKTP